MLSRKMRILLASLLLVMVLAAGASWYVLKVKPLQKQIATLETSIKSEADLLAKYEKGEVNQPVEAKDSLALQQKIPVIDAVDQFLLMLEEAEVVSGSFIRNMSFTKSTTASAETAADKNAVTEFFAAKDTDEILGTDEADKADETTESNVSTEPTLPEGLEKLTATLTVEAENYFSLEAFVRKVEQFERITNVEDLQFSGFEEVTKLDKLPTDRELLSYHMTISTYYFPKLEELKDEAPKYDPSAPANKKNPLYQGDLSDFIQNGKDLSSETYRVVEENGKTYHVYSYDVKSGDTLFQLSVKYYNSREGEELIKSWNQLKQLEAETAIEIPVPVDSGI